MGANVDALVEGKEHKGPHVKPSDLDELIVKEQYHVFPGTTVTVCALTLKNGYVVTGDSACADPANFDEHLGRAVARAEARDKIWPLEGYLLVQRQWAERESARPFGVSEITVHCSAHQKPLGPGMNTHQDGTTCVGA